MMWSLHFLKLPLDTDKMFVSVVTYKLKFSVLFLSFFVLPFPYITAMWFILGLSSLSSLANLVKTAIFCLGHLRAVQHNTLGGFKLTCHAYCNEIGLKCYSFPHRF